MRAVRELRERSVFVAVVLLWSWPCAGADVDTSQWKCEFCPFPEGYAADVDAGADYVSDDAARFGNGTGYDEAGGYINVNGAGKYLKNGYQLDWFIEDLGLDSRVLEIDAARPGKYEFNLGYSELPYRRFDTTSTVFTAPAAGTLVLPATWVRSGDTSGFSELALSLRPQNIESDRQTISAGARFFATPEIRVFVDYQHQQRDGVDILSGANFIQGSLLPRFFDFETDLFEVGVEFLKGPFNLSLGWSGSYFSNALDSLTWDNPFKPFPGAEQGRLAQEPDNEYRQIALAGSYRSQWLDTLVSFSAAAGTGEQDSRFLPYTVNPSIATGDLPRANLGGKVDTTNYAFKVTSQPLRKLRLRLSYRLDERDNQTPRSSWTRVVVDSFSSSGTELNTPFSFERSRLSLGGSYRIFDSLRVQAGYERTELERDFQEVAEQTEDSGWGKLLWRPNNWFEVSAKGGSARREIDRYDEIVAVDLGQNPLLRKYNLAFRYREFGELNLSAAPPKLPVTFGISALWADDNFTRSQLGMTGSETTHWNLDLDWAVSDTATVYLYGGEESIEARQAGSQGGTVADWFATHADDFRTIGGGLRLNDIGDKAALALNYTHAFGRSRINVDRNRRVTDAFPDIDSDMDSLELILSYDKSAKLDIELRLRYENLDTDDWALAGVAPGTIPTVLALGAKPYDFDVWILGASFNYSIGGGPNDDSE